MAEPKHIDIVRRAYELWQKAGEPDGKDEEFYLWCSKSCPMKTSQIHEDVGQSVDGKALLQMLGRWLGLREPPQLHLARKAGVHVRSGNTVLLQQGWREWGTRAGYGRSDRRERHRRQALKSGGQAGPPLSELVPVV